VGRIDGIGGIGRRHAGPKSRAALAAALRDAREYTRRAYEHLRLADPVFPRLDVVNPARWELGHVAWFQEFWCRRFRTDDRRGARTPPRLPGADALFDSTAVPHATRWSLPLPDWDGIDGYLDRTLDDTLGALEASPDGKRYFFELALYHEDMHVEALLMTLHTLGYAAPAGLAPPAVGGPALRDDSDLSFDGGPLVLGSDDEDARARFVFDNERDAHVVVVAPFAIARRCVTEGEFADFVADGGYARADHWSDAGRAWLASCGRTVPADWRRDGDATEVREFDRWRPRARSRPVQHVNAFEAEAWCAWAGRRLPSEAEWQFAATHGDDPIDGDALDARHAGPSAAVGGRARFLGGAWEWTATAFEPYPGFAAGPYAEYSAPWFGDHRVLRGGSWATRSRLAHAGLRNFYLPARHDPFAGFRGCRLEGRGNGGRGRT